MAWITCGGCQLKHTARPDGLCPRCGAATLPGAAPREPVPPHVAAEQQPLEAVPVAAPRVPQPPPPPAWGAAPGLPADPWAAPPAHAGAPSPYVMDAARDAPTGFPLGARIAGGVLLLNAILSLALAASGDAGDGLASKAWTSAVFDVVIGALLLAGKEKVKGLAIFRSAAGAVVFGGLAFAQGGAEGILTGVAQIAFSAMLLLLLVGRPGPLRIVLASAPLGAGLVLVLVSVGILKGGVDVPGIFLSWSGQATRSHVEELRGEEVPWRLPLAGERWHRYTAASEVRRSNAVIDEAVVDPESQANVLVIAEELPPEADGFSPDLLVQVMQENARRGYGRFEPEDVGIVPGTAGTGRIFHALLDLQGQPAEGWFAGYVKDGRAVQIIAVVPTATTSDEVRAELQEIAGALEL